MGVAKNDARASQVFSKIGYYINIIYGFGFVILAKKDNLVKVFNPASGAASTVTSIKF